MNEHIRRQEKMGNEQKLDEILPVKQIFGWMAEVHRNHINRTAGFINGQINANSCGNCFA